MVHSALWLVGKLCRYPTSDAYRVDFRNGLINISDELIEELENLAQKYSMENYSKRLLKSENNKLLLEFCDDRLNNLFCVKFLFDTLDLFDKNIDLLNKRGDMIIT